MTESSFKEFIWKRVINWVGKVPREGREGRDYFYTETVLEDFTQLIWTLKDESKDKEEERLSWIFSSEGYIEEITSS